MYNKIGLEFLFLTLKTMGMAQEFVGMVKMLIQDVETYICLKEGITHAFKIEKGVKQRCPLAPYLFVLARDVQKDEKNPWNVINLLQLFLCVDGLEIYWEKLIAYYICHKKECKKHD